ncbi:hypothetical protein V866_002845 [Kwoniella sp. B9012]
MLGAYTCISSDPGQLDPLRDEVMRSRETTHEDVARVFASQKYDRDTFDLYFGGLDWDILIEKYHDTSTTVEARRASIVALVETAITNPFVTMERAHAAGQAIAKWHDPEYSDSEEKKMVVWQYGLDHRDDEGALKVLRWQTQGDSTVPILSEYGKEMLAIDLTRRVQDTLYDGRSTEQVISRLPSEATGMLPEKARSHAEKAWRLRSLAYDSRFSAPDPMSPLVLDEMMRVQEYKHWDKCREGIPITSDESSHGVSSKANAQLPPYDPGDSSFVRSDEELPTYAEIEQALSRFTPTDMDKKRIYELRKQYGGKSSVSECYLHSPPTHRELSALDLTMTEAMPGASTPASENGGSTGRSQRKHSKNWENFSKIWKSCFGSIEDTA